MEDKSTPVVWIASYPKSGNTWLQLVIRRAAPKGTIADRDLDIYKIQRSRETPERSSCVSTHVAPEPAVIAKTHTSFPQLDVKHGALDLRTAGFVYVLRNPLDMLLSFINFSRIQYQKQEHVEGYRKALFNKLLGVHEPPSAAEWAKVDLDSIPREWLDHALTYFTEHNTSIPTLSDLCGGSWRAHAHGWVGATTQIPSVVMRYEDMLSGEVEFQKLCQLFDFSETAVISAVKAANANQRNQQGANIFYNKMAAYYYPKYFSEDRVGDFVSKFEQDLKALGYAELVESPFDPH